MAKDLAFDEDLVFQDGDILVRESDQQHVKHLLVAQPGHYKNVPLLGIGIANYLYAPASNTTTRELERSVKMNLEADGATDVTCDIDLSLQNIEITAKYVSE